jgi:NADH:ubiquinone oxidoreductase subunit E
LAPLSRFAHHFLLITAQFSLISSESMFKLFKKAKVAAPRVIDTRTLLQLARKLEERATNGVVAAQDLKTIASELELPVEDLYAALGTSMQTSLALEHEQQFVVCIGGCQAKGALSCVETLLEIRAQRLGAGQAGFDVVPRQCLSRCGYAPVVEIRSKDGDAVLTAATPKSVAGAVKELLD